MKERELTVKQRQYFRKYRPRHTERDWDLLRMKIPSMDILTLPIGPLYIEIMGKPWPGKRRPAPISSYFDQSYEELVKEAGFKPKEIDLLIDLVSRVVRTEEGAKDMVQSERITSQTNDFFFRTLEKLGVRPDLRIDFLALDEETLELCEGAEADDLEKVLRYGIFLSEKQFLSGDLRDLVNAVSTESQQLLSKFLPVVPGERGIKPWKAMENVLDKIPERFRAALVKFYDGGSPHVAEDDRQAFEQLRRRLDMIGLEFRALFPEPARLVRQESEGAAEVFRPIFDDEKRSLARCVVRGRPSSSSGKAAEGSRKRGSFVRGILGRVGVG
ncbi:MAG: hypothetical protein ACLFRP_08985 [Puniceicoccaceae bacterium]